MSVEDRSQPVVSQPETEMQIGGSPFDAILERAMDASVSRVIVIGSSTQILDQPPVDE